MAHELRAKRGLGLAMSYLLHWIVNLFENEEVIMKDRFHFVWDRIAGAAPHFPPKIITTARTRTMHDTIAKVSKLSCLLKNCFNDDLFLHRTGPTKGQNLLAEGSEKDHRTGEGSTPPLVARGSVERQFNKSNLICPRNIAISVVAFARKLFIDSSMLSPFLFPFRRPTTTCHASSR